MPDLMIIAGSPAKGRGANPFIKGKGRSPSDLESPEPIGGRLKGKAALEGAGYHGAGETCGQCQNLREPDVCRKHMAKVDPDFGHCQDFAGKESESPDEEVVEDAVEEDAERVA